MKINGPTVLVQAQVRFDEENENEDLAFAMAQKIVAGYTKGITATITRRAGKEKPDGTMSEGSPTGLAISIQMTKPTANSVAQALERITSTFETFNSQQTMGMLFPSDQPDDVPLPIAVDAEDEEA